MHTFIDGYNVTRSDPATRDLPLEEQRDALEERMCLHARDLIGKGTYTIVWDGAGGEGVVHRTEKNVAFTRKPTADDSIVGRVRASREKVRIVTSDRELANRCKSAAVHGAEIIPSNKLFESAVRSTRTTGSDDKPTGGSKRGKKGKRISGDIGIPPNANKINEELKKLWVDE